jgi:hypothetical protein
MSNPVETAAWSGLLASGVPFVRGFVAGESRRIRPGNIEKFTSKFFVISGDPRAEGHSLFR